MKVKEFTTTITKQFTSLGKESSRIHTYGTNVYGLFDFNGYRYHFNAFLRNGKADSYENARNYESCGLRRIY